MPKALDIQKMTNGRFFRGVVDGLPGEDDPTVFVCGCR